MTQNKIKAVIFDVGGVLVLGHPAKKKICDHVNIGVHHTIANHLNISIDQWFDSIDTIYVKAFEGKLSKQQTLELMARNLKTNPKKLERLWIQSYRRCFSQNVELYEFAYNLKKQGYKITILSDQWSVSKEAVMLKRYTNKFDVIVSSDEIGIRKPNPEIYNITLKR